MPCIYLYLQEYFHNRFDGAVSITVVLKESDNKVAGSSPNKTFFFFLLFTNMQEIFRDVHVCRKKCFDVLCTCKATSLSKMAKLVWRYSGDARAIFENVYKFFMEDKKSGRTLSLNRVWDRTAALTGVSRSTAQKIYGREEEGTGRAATAKATTVIYLRKCHWVTVHVRRTIAKMYYLKKVLPTLDNIRTELKQSIGYTGSKGRFRKDFLQIKFAYTRCGVNRKVLMERQDVVLSRISYLCMVRESREAGFTVVYT